MSWLKRKLEIRRLKKLAREKLREMMLIDRLAIMGSPAAIRRERELEHEVDEIRARIAELRGDAE